MITYEVTPYYIRDITPGDVIRFYGQSWEVVSNTYEKSGFYALHVRHEDGTTHHRLDIYPDKMYDVILKKTTHPKADWKAWKKFASDLATALNDRGHSAHTAFCGNCGVVCFTRAANNTLVEIRYDRDTELVIVEGLDTNLSFPLVPTGTDRAASLIIPHLT